MNTDEQYHILALKKGNRESFKWVFDRYHQALYSYTWSLFKSDKWAEDICAEVFLAVWTHRENLKPQTFKSYIFQIAKNKVLNQLKKVAADTRQEKEFIRRYLDHSEHLRQHEEIIEVRMGLLKNEIDDLPPKRKEIIERKYFLGQKDAQIAQDMGITIHTVKAQLYKARLHLKSKLGDKTETDHPL